MSFAAIYQAGEDMLSAYCARWSAFSASVEKIAEMYLPYTILLNEIYEALHLDSPCLVSSMARIWEQQVYTPLAESHNGQLLEIFRKLRGGKVADREDMIASAIRAVEALVDLSTDSETVR